MTTQKEVMKEMFDASTLIVGMVGLSFASKKIIGRQLGTPTESSSIVKLVLNACVTAAAIKVLKDKKYWFKNPWED